MKSKLIGIIVCLYIVIAWMIPTAERYYTVIELINIKEWMAWISYVSCVLIASYVKKSSYLIFFISSISVIVSFIDFRYLPFMLSFCLIILAYNRNLTSPSKGQSVFYLINGSFYLSIVSLVICILELKSPSGNINIFESIYEYLFATILIPIALICIFIFVFSKKNINYMKKNNFGNIQISNLKMICLLSFFRYIISVISYLSFQKFTFSKVRIFTVVWVFYICSIMLDKNLFYNNGIEFIGKLINKEKK